MKFWAKLTCKKVGHKYGDWVPDDSKSGLGEYMQGWDLFVQKCNHCGNENTAKQYHTVTEQGYKPGDFR